MTQGRILANALIASEISSFDELPAVSGLSRPHTARALKSLLIPPDVITKLASGFASRHLTLASVRQFRLSDWDAAVGEWQYGRSVLAVRTLHQYRLDQDKRKRLATGPPPGRLRRRRRLAGEAAVEPSGDN